MIHVIKMSDAQDKIDDALLEKHIVELAKFNAAIEKSGVTTIIDNYIDTMIEEFSKKIPH